MAVHHHLRRFVKNPYLQLVVGVVLLVSTLLSGFELEVHHGFAIIGIWHITQAAPGILQALERISRWRRKK
jgi:hypothetical protein